MFRIWEVKQGDEPLQFFLIFYSLDISETQECYCSGLVCKSVHTIYRSKQQEWAMKDNDNEIYVVLSSRG